MTIGRDDGPFPNTFEANTFMMISLEGEQDDVDVSNSCTHVPFMHIEARIVREPQMSPLREAEYVIVYDVVELLMVSVLAFPKF